jgi:hypothetical protein
MTKKIGLLAAVFLGSLSLTGGAIASVQAQVDTAWVRRYNGPGNGSDQAYAMAVDGNGNVYVTGQSYGIVTNFDYATIKYYSSGDTAWVRRYNGPGNGDDYAYSQAVDDSGSVYVTGGSAGLGTEADYTTIKYRVNGDTVWVKSYNGPGNNSDYAEAITVDGSGDVYVTGNSYGSGTSLDYATIKYLSNGDTAWVRRYNGTGNGDDYGWAIAVDDSGNVYVTGGSIGSGTSYDYTTIKYDSAGDTLWVRRYNGPGDTTDVARAIYVDKSANVYITGESYGSGTKLDYATIKYYSNGDTAWVRRYNGPGNATDEAAALSVDKSGNIYVTGNSYGSGTQFDYATIKYYPNGDTGWVRRYNGPGNNSDFASAITTDKSGNIYVTGYSSQIGSEVDYTTIMYHPDGDSVWLRTYNGPGNGADTPGGIVVDDSDNVYVTGYSYGGGTDFDYATVKYVQSPSGVEDESQVSEKPLEFNLSQNYPNPFNPTTSIRYTVDSPQSTVHGSIRTTLKIYDVLGEEIKTLVDEKEFPGDYTVPWDGRNEKGEPLASGVYLYELRVGNHTSSKKMVLLK